VTRPLILLAAGGTGGHLFPAEALAVALRRLDLRVALATDTRVDAIAESFPADIAVRVRSATPSGRSVVGKARAALELGLGVLGALRLLRSMRPACVVGFGGYPTVPPLFAAAQLGIPTLIHEQNGVVGRANRFLLSRMKAIATGFATVGGLPPEVAGKTYHTGNPVRPAVLEAADAPYGPLGPEEPLRILVFGGSQGARVMSDVAPAAFASLAPEARRRLSIVQQARAEDAASVRSRYATPGSRPWSSRSSSTCPAAWRRRISSSRAPARPPWPNSPPSAGPRSWSRCPAPSTRTRPPTRVRWKGSAPRR
jgi:UDP-N-acetylglucosamine--N-acetylmuramyl-(pentapeptide) pyrophosphoryl-undecaprenol N-acetylglucosamine transferase